MHLSFISEFKYIFLSPLYETNVLWHLCCLQSITHCPHNWVLWMKHEDLYAGDNVGIRAIKCSDEIWVHKNNEFSYMISKLYLLHVLIIDVYTGIWTANEYLIIDKDSIFKLRTPFIVFLWPAAVSH